MSEIDLSQAPEGATHYNTLNGIFYCFPTGGTGLCWRPMGQKWEKVGAIEEYGSFLIPVPTTPQWNGEGLPPVGAVCEYNLMAGPWYPCEVRYVLDNDQHPDADGWQAVIWCPHLEKEQVAKASGFNFRPIRTPEQIAAEEREKAINIMIQFFEHDELIKDSLGKLYDAGYRKQEAAK